MNTRATQQEQSSLDSDIDSVFGPMGTTGDDVNDEADAGDDDTSQDESEGGQQQQTQNAGDEQSEEVDPLTGLAPSLKAPPLRDAQGNIVDKDGNILARTRDERREMYNYNRLRVAADKITQDRDRLKQENEQLRVIKDMPGRLGLSLEHVSEAMEFRAKLERDPVSTVRDIVARVMGNGYTMEQLFGADAPGYINAQLMQRQLDERLRPLNERIASDDRETRIRETAEREMNTFISEHEYADVHGEAIAHFVANNPDTTPQKAYYELRQWATQNGLDFTKPLREQVVAKLEARNNNGGGNGQQTRRQAPSTPGSVRTPAALPNAGVQDNAYAAPDSSYRDIVANAFRDLANGGARP